jgi:hypothetical protein
MEKQHSAWTTVLTAFVALISFAGVRFLVTEARQDRTFKTALEQVQDGSAFENLRTGEVTPYAFIVAGEKADPIKFRRAFAQSIALTLRRSIPDGELRIDDHAVTRDLGIAWRGSLGFTGRASFEGSPYMDIQGEVRGYYHDYGSASIEAICIEDMDGCDASFHKLVDEAEAGLLKTLSSNSFDNVLPYSDECDIEKVDMPERQMTLTMLVCFYEPAGALSLARHDIQQTVEMLRAVANDPEAVRIMRGR